MLWAPRTDSLLMTMISRSLITNWPSSPGSVPVGCIGAIRKVRKDVAPDAKWQRGRILSDQLAAAVLPLIGGAAGATVGGLAGGGRGARAGGLIGAGALAAPGMAAAIAAAITRRRTREEQEKAERTHGALSYVVPGKATYDIWKRLGYSGNYDNEQRLRRLEKAFKAKDKTKETKSE